MLVKAKVKKFGMQFDTCIRLVGLVFMVFSTYSENLKAHYKH